MFTVAIADDEVNIVEGLLHTICWEEYDCKVIGTAFNGLDAKNLAEEQKPDIMIADITMPKMNGLDMIKALKDTLQCTSFVILTCHEDFDMSRNALRLGASDYVLKETMTRQEFYQSLEKAKRDCLSKRKLAGRDEVEEDPEVVRMKAYIKEHLSQRLTLEDMAEYMAMNTSYFSRFFKSRMGENFVDYLTKVRIQFAMEQLRKTNQSIEMIAEKAGYVNQSYFNTAFKKISGVTPSKYRKEKREKQKQK